MESKQMTEKSVNDIDSEMNEIHFDEKNSINIKLPNGITKLETQVAGHVFDPIKNTTGVLRCNNGCILKSYENSIHNEREINVYEQIQASDDPVFKELLNLTPKYYGPVELDINNKKIKFFKLEDITDGMMEPCVMDIKIGKRTWDPLADADKRHREDQKYSELKEAFGFCIPGFQVYDLNSGNLSKYSKEYGRNLNAKTLIEALKIFLNINEQPSPCREFVIKLLSPLWKILAFFRRQKSLRFYSSSLIIAYDVKRLRQLIRLGMANDHSVINPSSINMKNKTLPQETKFNNSKEISPGKSLFSLSPRSILLRITKKHKKKSVNKKNELKVDTNQIMADSKNSSKDTSSPNTLQSEGKSPNQYLDEKRLGVEKICRTHSYNHNYERDIIEMKDDYAILLKDLTGHPGEHKDWVRVYIIDLAHVFPAEDNNVDHNFLEGIENLTKILESLLLLK